MNSTSHKAQQRKKGGNKLQADKKISSFQIGVYDNFIISSDARTQKVNKETVHKKIHSCWVLHFLFVYTLGMN